VEAAQRPAIQADPSHLADTAPAALGGPPAVRRPAARPALPWRWAGAVLLGLAALLAQWLVRPWLGGQMPFIFVLPAVALAAALWGRLAGGLVLAVVMAGSVRLLQLPPGALAGGELVLPLLLLALMGGLLVALSARLRDLRSRARAAEARLMLAIEGTGMGVFEIDIAARRVHLSPGLARHMGLPAGPLPLARWLAAMPPAVMAPARQEWRRQLRRQARSYEQTLHLPPADTALVGAEWLLLRLQIDWSGLQPAQLRGVCLDITARKRTEDALAEARAALERQVDDLGLLHQLSSRLLDDDGLDQQLGVILQTLAHCHGSLSGVVLVLEDGDTRLRLAAAQGLGGGSLGQLRRALDAPGAAALARRPAGRVVVQDTETDPLCAPWRALARHEGLRALHATPLVSRSGALLGWMAVPLAEPRQPTERECRLADICARKAAVFLERARAQAALAAAKDRFQAVLESSAVPFTVLAPERDAQGAITDFRWRYVNGAAARALGRPAQALPGRRVLRSLRARGLYGGHLQMAIDVVQRGRPRQAEIHLRTGGHDSWVQCIASPLHDEVAVWFNDITGRKRDEQLLRDAARRKDEFLAMLAHELRNPLAPIRQAALLLQAPGISPAQVQWSHAVIERQVQHMAMLLDDLLDVSRITRGVLVLRSEAVWLQSVVDVALETARPLIDARSHRLTLQLPAVPVQLQADALRLSQVLGNLLSNAARYTDPQGQIDLRCRVDGQGLHIEVSDNGIGIAAQALPQVFEMFNQLPQAGERTQGGLGIGLALARALVALHGGSISAHSDGPGRGSRFSVWLPPALLLQPAAPAPVAARPAGQPAAEGAGLRLLVADDNRDAARSLAMLLQTHGHQVHQAFDGDQALADFQRLTPQVCLLDIGMPGRDGYSLARAIRRQNGPQPVLIAVTGWGQAHDRARALAAGFDHHLTKPVDVASLLALVTAAAELH